MPLEEQIIGRARLICGDCREVLPLVDSEGVVTDPPYGHDYASNGGPRGCASWKGTAISNDDSTSARDEVITWAAKRPCVVFGSWKRPRPPATKQVLIWDKGPAFGMGDLSFPWKNSFEEIYILGDGFTGKRDEAVLRGPALVSWESHGRLHPNQKPVWLLRYLISKTVAQTILDPFMGSGTTGSACIQLGRNFVGIEIKPRWFDVACRRLEQEMRQGNFFWTVLDAVRLPAC
jgi:DNA modification methylase